MPFKNRLAKLGSHLTFEFFIALIHDDIVKGIKTYLAEIQPDDIRAMIAESRFPPMEHLDFAAVSDNAEYLESIKEIRLMEIIAEARPDLAMAIQDTGMPGAEYIAKLRRHLLNMVKQPEKGLAESTDYQPTENMVRATCDKCGKSWAVPKGQASAIDKCPFCHQ